MKKFLTSLTAVLLSLCLCIGLAACGGGGGTHEGDHDTDNPYESTGEYHTVTFDSRGGSEVEAQTVLDGDYARQPSRPEKAGSYFLHWSEEIEGERFVFTSRIITKDITLYAVWNDAYTVIFDTQGGSAVPSQTVVAGTSARKPDMPTREGYNFLGWYTSSAGTTAWEWNAPVTTNITVYAHWEDANTQTPTASLTFSYNSTLGGFVVTGAGQETAIRIPATASDRTHASANVVGIDARAFSYSDIVSVSLPATITSIGEYAFNRCDNLVSVEIPAAVTEIGNYAFANCAALSSVTFGTGDLALETIGARAFAYDPALTELTIPASVTSIGSNLIRSSGITTVHFLGTRSAWEEVAKEGWDTGATGVTVICADEAPAAILSDRKELA